MAVQSRRGCDCPPGEPHTDGCGYLTGRPKGKTNYAIADPDSAYMGGWFPYGEDARTAYEDEREPAMARILDLYRNYGPVKGIVELIIQHLVGSFTPIPQPDKKILTDWTNEEIQEMVSNITCWHENYLEGEAWCDAAEKENFTGMMQCAMRTHEVYGEITGTAEFLNPAMQMHSHRPFGSACMLFTPSRVFTPFDIELKQMERDLSLLAGSTRGKTTSRVVDGIRRNGYGKCLGGYVHDFTKHEYDTRIFSTNNNRTWKFIRSHGVGAAANRQLFFHDFQKTEAELNRGVSDFAASAETFHSERQLIRLIMLRAQRQTQVNAIFKSKKQMDTRRVSEMLGLTPGGGHQHGGSQDKNMLPHEWQIFGKANGMSTQQIAAIGQCSPEFQKTMIRKFHHKENQTSRALAGLHEVHLYEDEDYEQQNVDLGSLAATELLEMLQGSSAGAHSTPANKMRRNYDSGNYTGIRSGNLDFEASLMPKKRSADRVANWIVNTAAPESVERGLLRLPESVERRWNIETTQDRIAYFTAFQSAIMRIHWQMPQQKLIDPQKDAAGQGELEDREYRTRSEIVGQMSKRTYQTHLQMIEEDKRADIDSKLRLEKYEQEQRVICGLDPAPTDDN